MPEPADACKRCDRPLELEQMEATSTEPPLEVRFLDLPFLTCPEGHGPWTPFTPREAAEATMGAFGGVVSDSKGFLFWKTALCRSCERPLQNADERASERTISFETNIGDSGPVRAETSGAGVACMRCGCEQIPATRGNVFEISKTIAEAIPER